MAKAALAISRRGTLSKEQHARIAWVLEESLVAVLDMKLEELVFAARATERA